MARRDHYYDPAAPQANSIVVAVTVFAQDDEGRVLLIHRTDNSLWSLPGGTQEVGENISSTAVRETREETGLEVEVTGLVGVYSNPNHVVAYDDGEVRQQFAICVRARTVGGNLTGSSESADVRWVRREELDSLPIHPSTRLRISHGYDPDANPYLG
ncbi:NUDIX domain-containing protein [Micromonospora sp. NPDC051296]|uniref:NUDIX hydrolase n=1 Tax=Micromonospora sp. NPDC051296 TaxID=3155046 RepID=UPI003428C1E5